MNDSVITIAEFLTELNLDLIHNKDKNITLDMDLFDYLEILGVIAYED